MATNRELRGRATELAAELGIEIQTGGLGNAELSQLVSDLEARLEPPPPPSGPEYTDPESPAVIAASKPIDGAALDALGGPPPPELKRPAPKVAFYVAKGKALSCDGRIISEYQEIKASNLQGGAEQLKHLVSRGLVTRG